MVWPRYIGHMETLKFGYYVCQAKSNTTKATEFQVVTLENMTGNEKSVAAFRWYTLAQSFADLLNFSQSNPSI